MDQVRREIIDGSETVELVRTLCEVQTDDGMNLVMVHKRPAHGPSVAPVLLVHGLGQNRYSWTLSRRSFENHLVAQGFETFNAELRGHGLSRANGCEYPADFETYIDRDVPAVLRAIGRITGGRRIFYVGHSLGGTIAYSIDPALQALLAGIVSIGGPFDFGQGNRLLRLLAMAGVAAGTLTLLPRVHPEALYIDLVGLVAKRGLFFFDSRINVIPLRVWLPGSTERDILEERIEKGFDRTSFNVFWLLVQWAARGQFHGSDKRAGIERRIRELAAPILFVVADQDDVVPEQAVRPAYERVASVDKTLRIFGGQPPDQHFGHCDLICGRAAPRLVWPEIAAWMRPRA